MYGLIGKKIGHSFSAIYFNNKFEKENIDEEYRLFPLETIEKFPQLLDQQPDLKGLNVTIPYKSEVIKYLDNLSPEAKEMGAVNVIKFIRDGHNLKLEGYNTDAIGFEHSLVPLLNKNIKKALVLGTGGASKAVVYVLKKLGISPTLVSRSPGNGRITYNDIDQNVLKENLLIVNTTPLGMSPDIDTYAPIPYQYLTPDHICYDVVYNPQETEFMKRSAAQGAKVKNGIEMLEKQAVAAWDVWNR